MKKNNSLIVKNSMILYARLIVTSVISLVTVRIILDALGPADYGLFNVVGGVVFLMAFLNNVMTSSTYRFIAYELGKDDDSAVNMVFNVSLVIHLLIAMLVVLLSETIGIYYIYNHLNIDIEKLSDALYIFHLSIISVAFAIVAVPFQGLITAKEKFSLSATIEVTRSILSLISVLIVSHYVGNKLRLYATLIISVSIFTSLLYYLISKAKYSSIIAWKIQHNYQKYHEMLNYSGWIMLGATASAAQIQGSIIVINLFFGTVLNASYGIANQINTVVKMFSESLNRAVVPQITKNYSRGDNSRFLNLVIYSSKYSFYLMLIPSIPIILRTDHLLALWLKEVPVYTSIFVQLMTINALIATMSAGIPAAIQATGKIKYFQLFLSIPIVLGIPVSYFLFMNDFPPYSLLVYFTIISVLNIFVRQILLYRIINFDVAQYFKKAYLRMILVVIGIFPLISISKIFDNTFLGLVYFTVISYAWYAIVVLLVGTGKEERNLLWTLIGKKYKNAN